MKISNNLNYNLNLTKTNQLRQHSFLNINSEDSYVSKPKQALSPTFGSLFETIKKGFDYFKPDPDINEIRFTPQKDDDKITLSPFVMEIKEGLEQEIGKKLPNSSFVNIMSPDDVKELLPQLTPHCFKKDTVTSAEESYCVDLDYQTNFSNGKKNIFQILDEIAEYADEYVERQKEIQAENKRKGLPTAEIKPFIFAVTDKDCVESVKHAIRIIALDPERFKNVKFIPSVKLTYAHEAKNSPLNYENSELLVYGINPFSENLIQFTKNIVVKRQKMINNFIHDIKELYPEFQYNLLEFAEQNKLHYDSNYTESNLYWRVREYIESKGGHVIKGRPIIKDSILKEADELLSQLGTCQVGSITRDKDNADSAVIGDKDKKFNIDITKIFQKYSTHKNEHGEVVSDAENLYNEVITCLSKEKEKPVIALSAPFYLSHYFEDENSTTFEHVVDFIKNLKEESNDMLIAFESIVPSYGLDDNLHKERIKQFNKYMRENTGLYEVGGSFEGVKPN